MITAVDTNVLVDVLSADTVFGERSREAVASCALAGQLVASDVVWAELGSAFREGERAIEALDTLEVAFSATERASAELAGRAWRAYRAAGGGARTRLVADFLIGAHASAQADRLLTRDRGFYRAYFTDLEIVDPTAAPG